MKPEPASFQLSCDMSSDSAHPSQATLPGFSSIVERLRKTGKFTPEQIGLIEVEVESFFHRNDLSYDGQMIDGQMIDDSLIGQQVGGYRISHLIGEGGSGRVFQAVSVEDPGSLVALKIIKQFKSSSRFRREMDLVQRLAHPNVVVAYEVGEYQDKLFIVMEELTGPDLHQYVQASGPIPWRDSLVYLIDAASGLEHAHQRGLIHRDVKPGNLVLDGNRIKVTDLGLAVLCKPGELFSHDDANENQFETQSEALCGTVDFMAPEQAKSLETANARSDIYGLGATWFYLLTGETRVKGRTTKETVVNLIQGNGLRDLPESVVPPEVRLVCEKMFAYQPEDRYQSMQEVKEALQSLAPTSLEDAPKNCIDVMIVEDDQDDLLLTMEMLQRGNNAVRVVSHNTLHAAISHQAQERDFDLVLLDLQLPDSQGVETVERFLESIRNVPVIVLTGHEDGGVAKACIAAGADDYVCKNDLTPHLLERMIFVTLSRYARRSF